MGFEFPVVDRKYGAGDTVPLRTRVNSVTNMSAEVVAFACLDRCCFNRRRRLLFTATTAVPSPPPFQQPPLIPKINNVRIRKESSIFMITGFNFTSHRGNVHHLEIGMNSFHDHRKGGCIRAQKKASKITLSVIIMATTRKTFYYNSLCPPKLKKIRWLLATHHPKNPWPIRKSITSNDVASTELALPRDEMLEHVFRYRTVDMDNHVVIQMTCPERNATS
ncbi:hypothetical protein NC651_020023 [Populus alba x Populus x berolinensis]|nr:hypothetical protein NC651_020023 [Populus alba x Populus x berolinensis]